MAVEFDPGPPKAIAEHLAKLPSIAAHRKLFWYDWGPIFYRGRLDGSAKLLGVASDPGPTERVAGRTLVGDAGQRVQGFLAKLGLERSYVLANAHPYALHPGSYFPGLELLEVEALTKWRNKFYDAIVGPKLEAIVAFGGQAKKAIELWDARPAVPLLEVPHPSNVQDEDYQDKYRGAVADLRDIVTPDPGGDATLPNYGSEFRESDYAPIPKRDLPYGLPAWFGDDAWGRADIPRHNNCVKRPSSDSEHTILWQAPKDQP